MMRVIAGKARRLQLKTIPGDATRPTTDKIKETIFNMLMPILPESRFLDIFSGSGGIAIEALSRGASYAVLIEKNPRAVEMIRENLKTTHLAENARIMPGDFRYGLKKLEQTEKEPFDIIFMDPPYNHQMENEVLDVLENSSFIDEHTLIIVEMSKETDISTISDQIWELTKVKEYKTNKHIFLRRR